MADMRRLPSGEWINLDHIDVAFMSLLTHEVVAPCVKVEFAEVVSPCVKVAFAGEKDCMVIAQGFHTREEAQQWLDEFMKGEK